MDLNALSAHKISNISHRSCKVIYAKLGLHIVKFCIDQSATPGVFELDESYFGARRVRSRRGRRGRGAAGKTPIFGRFKRDGKLHVEIVRNCSCEALMPII